MNEYTCYYCGQTFEKGWSDAEAAEEAIGLWAQDIEDGEVFVTICDDCFGSLVTPERVAAYHNSKPPFSSVILPTGTRKDNQ